MKDNLDDDGFPYDGARLNSGDIIIGKHAEEGADHSIKLKHGEKGSVQKVVLSANDDGKNFTTVSLRHVRIPSLGDNFSSMHGQKGVLGFLESQENFPFTIQGIVTDIVINPHAFPSRQTPGELLEAALGKGIALGGSVEYVTSFSTPTIETRTDQLHMCGFSRWGNERVYDRLTGEKVESLMFMGLTFYQKLVHISEDKVRGTVSKGLVIPLTEIQKHGECDPEVSSASQASRFSTAPFSPIIVVTNGWNAILRGLDIAHPVAKSMIELTRLGMRKLVTELHQSLLFLLVRVYGVLFEGDFHRQMVVNNHYTEWSWIDFHTLLRRSHFCPFLVFEKDDALSWNGTNENMHEHGEDDPQDALEALRKKTASRD
ncbi:DNA-directed RNA polymerases IV and V subunit 2-like protein [Tanacetum coccineum]